MKTQYTHHILRCAAFACVTFLLSTLLHAQTTTKWDGSEDNKWKTADNWDNGLPTSNQNTLINTGSVLLDTSATVRYLYLGTDSGATANLTIADGATLSIGGASVSRIGTGTDANATVTQTGGTVTVNPSNYLDLGGMSSGSTRTGGTATYTISNGSLTALNSSGLQMSANTSSSSISTFDQKGGTVTLGGLTVGAGRKTSTSTGTMTNTATYAISAGSLTVNGDFIHGTNGNTGNGYIEATTNVIGSKATINVGGNLTLNNNARNTSTLSYSLDDGGVSKINLTGSSTGTSSVAIAGTLKVGFKGGLALTTEKNFALIETSSGNVTGSFTTTPDAALWSVSTTSTTVTASFAGTAKATFDASESTMKEATFAASSTGYASLSGLTVGENISLYLAADAGSGKNIADLVTYFNANGIVATAVNDGAYSILITKQTGKETSYLAWDLNDFNAGATLSAIKLATTAIPEPATVTLLVGAIAGALFIMAKRRHT